MEFNSGFKGLIIRPGEGLHATSANLEEVLLSMTCCVWLHRTQCVFWEANIIQLLLQSSIF